MPTDVKPLYHEGFTEVAPTVWANGREVIVVGRPPESTDEETGHNCDAMGCGWDHVLWRAPLAAPAAPRAGAEGDAAGGPGAGARCPARHPSQDGMCDMHAGHTGGHLHIDPFAREFRWNGPPTREQFADALRDYAWAVAQAMADLDVVFEALERRSDTKTLADRMAKALDVLDAARRAPARAGAAAGGAPAGGEAEVERVLAWLDAEVAADVAADAMKDQTLHDDIERAREVVGVWHRASNAALTLRRSVSRTAAATVRALRAERDEAVREAGNQRAFAASWHLAYERAEQERDEARIDARNVLDGRRWRDIALQAREELAEARAENAHLTESLASAERAAREAGAEVEKVRAFLLDAWGEHAAGCVECDPPRMDVDYTCRRWRGAPHLLAAADGEVRR